MVHITALALVPAAPPGFQGRWPGALPTHAPLKSWGILGRAASPHSTRPLVDSETTLAKNSGPRRH